MKLIDFAARQVPPEAIKSAGYDGVVAYVSESRPGANFGAKPLTREYADALRAAGLQIVSNFQYGKPGGLAPSDFTRGFDGGVADAKTAARLHADAGGPDTAPILFSIDDDIDLTTWNDVAVDWFRGINSVLGVERTGIYGHSRVCAWAIQDGVVGRSSTPGHHWVWQTKAWSQGHREDAAVLFQGVIDTPSNPGPLIGSTRVDVNDVLAADFGQWDLDRTALAAASSPSFTEHTDIRSPYHGTRQTAVKWFVLHTEDGNSASAHNLAKYLSNNLNRVSYHYAVDNDGQLYSLVDTNRYSNSVFEPGNSKSINIAFAGSHASWSRQTWLDRMQRGIDIAAYIAVRDCRRNGLEAHVISPEAARAGRTGITDHNGVVIATGVGDHTDVGPGFPWDYFRQKLGEYTAPEAQPAPPFPGGPIRDGVTGPDVVLVQNRLNAVDDAGLLVDGEFAAITGRAVTTFQTDRGLDPDGQVGQATWDRLFLAARHDAVPAARPMAGPFRDVTGPGITSSVGMEAADLGIMRWDPNRQAIAAMFGDNFELVGMRGDWQSPSIVMYDRDHNVLGIPDRGNRIAHNTKRRQLWPYGHNNPDYDTVLPCDFIYLNGWWYVAVMLSKGRLDAPNAQWRTEFWRSRDLVDWGNGPIGPGFDHRTGDHPGNTMLTFDRIGDWVYIFGTGGLTRRDPIWMWRNRADEFPNGYWEPWGFRPDNGWRWGNANEQSPILRGAYGELCFRNVQGNCVLSYFDAGAGKTHARTIEIPEHNWQDGANLLDYAFAWQVPNLYGGYISPMSRLNEPNGMQFFVSQWSGPPHNEPYRVMLVRGTLPARGPLRNDPLPGLDVIVRAAGAAPGGVNGAGNGQVVLV